jgi:hypothetical protein
MYPKQYVNPELAQRAGIPNVEHDWDRHPYEAMLPGFGGSDSMDWTAFLEILMESGFDKPFVIENEAANSAHTGNIGATMQGFKAATLFLSPAVWPLTEEAGYRYQHNLPPYETNEVKDTPIVTMKELPA